MLRKIKNTTSGPSIRKDLRELDDRIASFGRLVNAKRFPLIHNMPSPQLMADTDIQQSVGKPALLRQEEDLQRQREEQHIDVRDHAYSEHYSQIGVSLSESTHGYPFDPRATSIMADIDSHDHDQHEKRRFEKEMYKQPPGRAKTTYGTTDRPG